MKARTGCAGRSDMAEFTVPGIGASFTVAICTHGRCDLLGRTLERMTTLRIPSGIEWEVLVVDNNSSDATPALLESFRVRLPLRATFEPRPGKSFAANRAVREARGDIILWTDDDVLVDPDWLVSYHRAVHRHPDVGIFGGPIDPWFDGTPPRWLKRAFPEVANTYAILDLGPEPIPFSHDVYPYGANMALRRSLHLREPFDTRIGPSPSTLMRGEEMVLVRKLLDAGEKGVWVPDARVRHFIPKERQTVRYLRRYFIGSGQVVAYLDEPPGRRLLGRPPWLWKEALVSELKYRLSRPFGKPETWIRYLRQASVAWGRLKGPGSARKGSTGGIEEA